MKVCLYPLLLICALTATAQAQVPRGNPPLMDGRIGKTEWADAGTISLEDFARVYIKESNGFVWLGMELLKAKSGTVDLYLSAEDGAIYDLHASAKLGERKLSGESWSDK